MIGCFGTAPRGGAGIEAAPGELVRVLVIVLADAEDVAARARDRRFQRDPRRAGSATACVGRPAPSRSISASMPRRRVSIGRSKGAIAAREIDQPDAALAADRECRHLHPEPPDLSFEPRRFLPGLMCSNSGARGKSAPSKPSAAATSPGGSREGCRRSPRKPRSALRWSALCSRASRRPPSWRSSASASPCWSPPRRR